MCCTLSICFFTHTAPTEIYTLSLHDALPILENWRSRTAATNKTCRPVGCVSSQRLEVPPKAVFRLRLREKCCGFYKDRKSTRLNSSHGYISYAVFCLKKKKKNHPYDRLCP